MVRRQPALLSVSVSGNVLEVAEFFSKEMGLGTDQVSKIFCCHPQVKMRFSCRRRFFCVEVSREAQNRCEANGTSQARGRKQPYMPQGIHPTFGANPNTPEYFFDTLVEPCVPHEQEGKSVYAAQIRREKRFGCRSPVRGSADRHFGDALIERGLATDDDRTPRSNNILFFVRVGVALLVHNMFSRQVLCLNLDKTVRPVVEWLGTPDPERRQQQQLQQQQQQQLSSPLGNKAMITDRDTQTTPPPPAPPGGLAASTPPGMAITLTTPGYVKGRGWDWGLGLGPEERNKVVSKQGDLVWKSVPTNLARSTAWFVQEAGLSWDDMRKVCVCVRVCVCVCVSVCVSVASIALSC